MKCLIRTCETFALLTHMPSLGPLSRSWSMQRPCGAIPKGDTTNGDTQSSGGREVYQNTRYKYLVLRMVGIGRITRRQGNVVDADDLASCKQRFRSTTNGASLTRPP